MSRSGSIEELTELKLDFSKLSGAVGCVPVAVQRADTKAVVLVAYTNEQAMKAAFRTRRLVLWSTSRNELWEKGATSGCRFDLVAAYVNCEQNSLLYFVLPASDGVAPGMCHTANARGVPRDCFYRRIDFDSLTLEHVDR